MNTEFRINDNLFKQANFYFKINERVENKFFSNIRKIFILSIILKIKARVLILIFLASKFRMKNRGIHKNNNSLALSHLRG